MAALVRQRFPELSAEQVAAYLKNNAEPRGAVPNNTWGYGLAKLPATDVGGCVHELRPTEPPKASGRPSASPWYSNGVIPSTTPSPWRRTPR